MSRSWSNAGRELAFRIRDGLRFSLPVLRAGRKPSGLDEALQRSFGPQEARIAERLRALRSCYDLERLAGVYTPVELREALYLVDLYDTFVRPFGPSAPGLDVGAKNGAHLPALATAVPGPWEGVELDGRRRYLTGVTREGYARHLIRRFPECTYRVGSVTDVTGTFGVVSWILPFVRVGALESWGLPHRFFEPRRLLAHVWELLSPRGVLFIVNQGQEEADAQAQLFSACAIPAKPLGELKSPLSPFRLPRFGWLATRPE